MSFCDQTFVIGRQIGNQVSVNNEMLRLDFNHGHDLVQIEKLNGRGTAFPEVYVFKLGCQFGAL
jgi:hypothetical protein